MQRFRSHFQAEFQIAAGIARIGIVLLRSARKHYMPRKSDRQHATEALYQAFLVSHALQAERRLAREFFRDNPELRDPDWEWDASSRSTRGPSGLQTPTTRFGGFRFALLRRAPVDLGTAAGRNRHPNQAWNRLENATVHSPIAARSVITAGYNPSYHCRRVSEFNLT
ncbi:hypothetical protein NUW54_g13552 [Trametes sanguinea]|uniref:Uncharacterized protein n=1 Tax=Trametes sanguinea TaxID=158606 RepID=A0ACC1MLW3_9APHY|nr:hypothetical protein NUW54_g13552 [Trametes sanguinea]